MEVAGLRDVEHLVCGDSGRARVKVLQCVHERAGCARPQRAAADFVRQLARSFGRGDCRTFVALGDAIDGSGSEQEGLRGGVTFVVRDRRAFDTTRGTLGVGSRGRLRPDPAQPRMLRRIADDRDAGACEVAGAGQIRDQHRAPRRAREKRDVVGVRLDARKRHRLAREMSPSRAFGRKREPRAARKARGGVDVAFDNGVHERRVHVVDCGTQPGERIVLVRARDSRAENAYLCREICRMPVPQRGRMVSVEARGREGPYRLEQPEATTRGTRHALQERLVDKLGQTVGRHEQVDVDNRGDGREFERSAEDCEREQQCALGVVEQLIGPVDGFFEREMMRRTMTAIRDGDGPPRVELFEDLGG